jgi:hypothetical protein
LIARVHAVQGLREEAARDLARVLEIEPGHVAAQEYLRRVTAATPRGLLRATPSKPSP